MDRNQFISQVKSNHKGLRQFLVALCGGDRQLADDIAQDALLKAYLSSDGFKDESKFRAWIFKIAYNTFLNNRRTEKPTAGYDAVPQATANDHKADAAFRYQELYAALGTLPERERTSILLYYLEGYSTKEIAEIVGSSTDAVKQQLSRGRSKLRHLLTDKT